MDNAWATVVALAEDRDLGATDTTLRAAQALVQLARAETIAQWTRASVVSDQEALPPVPAEAVLVGADAVSPRSVVNKVKTYELADAAAQRHLPRYAVAGSSKLVPMELPVVDPFQATPIGVFTQIATP